MVSCEPSSGPSATFAITVLIAFESLVSRSWANESENEDSCSGSGSGSGTLSSNGSCVTSKALEPVEV